MSHLRIISTRVIESDLYFRNFRHVALRRLNREEARIISVRLLQGYWCSHVEDNEKGLELGMIVKMRALCFYVHNALCQRYWYYILHQWASLVAQRLKRLPPMQETWVRSLGREDPLEKEMATHSSILAWRIPWMEEPGRLRSTGSQRVRHD